jgi:hypothetical protein
VTLLRVPNYKVLKTQARESAVPHNVGIQIQGVDVPFFGAYSPRESPNGKAREVSIWAHCSWGVFQKDEVSAEALTSLHRQGEWQGSHAWSLVMCIRFSRGRGRTAEVCGQQEEDFRQWEALKLNEWGWTMVTMCKEVPVLQ